MNRLVINMKGKWIIQVLLQGEKITRESRMDNKAVLDKIPGEIVTQDLSMPAEVALTLYESLVQKMVSQFGA